MSRRKIIETASLRLDNDHKNEVLQELEEGFARSLRGYSKMILAVHPDTGQRIDLGFAEIRAFGKHDKVYAAPNLLYHYVTAHHYKPPAEFVLALKKGPCPPDPEYINRLEDIGFSRGLMEIYHAFWQKSKRRTQAKPPL